MLIPLFLPMALGPKRRRSTIKLFYPWPGSEVVVPPEITVYFILLSGDVVVLLAFFMLLGYTFFNWLRIA